MQQVILARGGAYYAECEKSIQMATRTEQPFAVIFVDLDHFKRVNDTYGHAAGDAVLQAVANCLSKTVRNSDALGRIGGEEFSILMPNTNQSGAVQVAELLRKSVEALKPTFEGKSLPITASIGVAACNAAGESMKMIQQRADEAMYVAKSLGRNRVSVFGESK